jgi:hypothetical protein
MNHITAPLAAHWVQRRQQVSDQVMLIEHFDAITEIQSTLVCGMNKSSGKPYQRYDRNYVTYAMRPTSTGRRILRIFTKSSGPKKFSGVRDSSVVSSIAQPRVETSAAIERMIFRLTGSEPQLDNSNGLRTYMYPVLMAMISDGPSWQDHSLPLIGIGGHFRASTAQELTRSLFGKKRYRKDLVREVARAKPWSVRIAYDLRTVMEVDWLVEFLSVSTKTFYGNDRSSVPNLLSAFAAIPKHRRRALLMAIATDKTRFDVTRDTARMANQVIAAGLFDLGSIADCRNWREIHDTLITVAIATNEVKSAGERRAKIQRTPITDALHGTKVSGLRIETARNLDDLLLWGSSLRNCIGSYFGAARSGQSNLFVLVDDGRFVGNMEIDSNGTIQQLVGFANQQLPAELEQAIRAHVNQTLAPVLKNALTLTA